LIQGITSAGLASIFPAVSSPGNSALPDFESALFALLGAAVAPGVPATASNPELVAPAKTAAKTTASDPPPQNTAQKRPADENKPAFDQGIVPAAVLVPLPIPMPLPVQVDGAAPGAKLLAQPMSQQPDAPDSTIAQTAPSPPVRATSAASLPSSADPAVAAIQPSVVQALQQPAAGVKINASSVDLPHLDNSAKDETAQTPAPTIELDRTRASAKAEVAQSTASEQRISIESKPDVRGAIPGVQPASSQVAVPNSIQPGSAQAQPPTPDGPAQPTAQTPVATEPDKTLESVKAEVGRLTVPQPGYAQAQPQTPDTPAQPASFNPPVILVNPLGKSGFDQTAGGKSGHNPPAGKPSVGSSSTDRPGKERSTRAASPGQPKPDAPTGDAVKAIDQAGATDPLSAKAQPDASVADALPPQAPRAEVVPQSDASDPSPKTDASSPPAAHTAAANSSPLPAEKAPLPLFSSAQLIEKVSQSELRLGMRTGEFGNVEIRTTFDHQQLRAEISSERGELGQALSAELPGFEQRLREHDVPLSTVVVHQANPGASGGFDRPPRQQQPGPAPLHVNEVSGATLAAAVPQPEASEPEGILDVRI